MSVKMTHIFLCGESHQVWTISLTFKHGKNAGNFVLITFGMTDGWPTKGAIP
jgi:hypothetical protein